MSLIHGTTPYDTDQIVELRREINDDDEALCAVMREARTKERERCEVYDRLLVARRPQYPSAEQLRGLEQVAEIVHAGLHYGDHLGYATDEDRAAGRELPGCVQFSSRSNRVNVYARAPYAARSTRRLWSFTDHEVDFLRQRLRQLSLSIFSEWAHEDGVAFLVSSARV